MPSSRLLKRNSVLLNSLGLRSEPGCSPSVFRTMKYDLHRQTFMPVGRKSKHNPSTFFLRTKLDEIIPVKQYGTINTFLGRRRFLTGTQRLPIEKFYRITLEF